MTRSSGAISVAAGAVLALVALGMPLLLLLHPLYTSALIVRVGAPALADLRVEEARTSAEEVRAFVAGSPDVTLPATLNDGRPAFDESAVSHLDDVRVVLGGARVVTLAAVLAAAVWVVWTLRARRARELAFSLTFGAWAVAALAVLAALVALADFDRFFAGFHAIFFEAGTWQFPSDALLIRLFPERFWAASGAVWGALALTGAVLLGILGRLVRVRLVCDEA
jgi:integral membrane protein (TIGR01906 family)